MTKFELTTGATVELKGGMQAPIGCIVEVKVAGIQYPDAESGMEGLVGFSACLFLNATERDNKNHLMFKEVESAGPTYQKECLIGDMALFSDFTLETDTSGNLTQASIDSLKEAVKPKIAASLIGVSAEDLI